MNGVSWGNFELYEYACTVMIPKMKDDVRMAISKTPRVALASKDEADIGLAGEWTRSEKQS
jgi:hypothetical protein